MEFSRKKLPQAAATQLRLCEISSVKPYAPMLAPVYVLMRRNEKFVSVKAPLDFFVPEELERLKAFESFFLPAFVDSVLPFQNAARLVRALLGWEPEKANGVPPAPFELSDSILRIIGPLWNTGAERGLVLEPFFPAVFANELCDPLPRDFLTRARERSVVRYEHAIVCSGWAVFLALHTGYCSLGAINELRFKVFDDCINELVPGAVDAASTEQEEIEFVAADSLRQGQVLDSKYFEGKSLRFCRKISSRLSRVRAQLAGAAETRPTIFGERGFVDV